MKNTLVLGASIFRDRYSNGALKVLQEAGILVAGIGIRPGVVGEATIYTSQVNLSDIHTVSIYLNAENQKSYYSYIIELSPKRVIFNPGAENPELEKLLDGAQISFEKACTLVLIQTGQY